MFNGVKLNMVHVLLFVVVAFLLYYLISGCGQINGFKVSGQNSNGPLFGLCKKSSNCDPSSRYYVVEDVSIISNPRDPLGNLRLNCSDIKLSNIKNGLTCENLTCKKLHSCTGTGFSVVGFFRI